MGESPQYDERKAPVSRAGSSARHPRLCHAACGLGELKALGAQQTQEGLSPPRYLPDGIRGVWRALTGSNFLV